MTGPLSGILYPMRKLIPLLLSVIFVVPSFAEGIYKWVDEDGQTHFSDVPRDGAEEVELGPAQTFSLPAAATSSSATTLNDDAVEDDDEVKYESLVVTSPTQEETIWNTGGIVTVGVYLQPGLQLGHQIRVSLDGTAVSVEERSSSVQLSDVTRGEHTITAEVQDVRGNVLITSAPVTFFYQQTSVSRRPGAF